MSIETLAGLGYKKPLSLLIQASHLELSYERCTPKVMGRTCGSLWISSEQSNEYSNEHLNEGFDAYSNDYFDECNGECNSGLTPCRRCNQSPLTSTMIPRRKDNRASENSSDRVIAAAYLHIHRNPVVRCWSPHGLSVLLLDMSQSDGQFRASLRHMSPL
jgi:hypothetical protein